jgi:hypothetical protein
MDAGVTINRPPRDGYMAFVGRPDDISIELLQGRRRLPTAGAVGVDARMSAHGRDRPHPALSDNYIWLVHEQAPGETVVDRSGGGATGAGEAAGAAGGSPDLEHALASRSHRRQCAIKARRCTDHRPAPKRRIPTLDRCRGRRHRSLGRSTAPVLKCRPHGGHIAFHLGARARLRRRHPLRDGLRPLFEGTAEQMHVNLQRLPAAAAGDAGLFAGTIIRSRTHASR